jgi:death-on-curing family protein
MIASLLNKKPKRWLKVEFCKDIYQVFSEDFFRDLPLFETRFQGRLESIFNSVSQTFDGAYLNPTVLEAYISYFYQIVKGHPFIDGNKRAGVLFSYIFLLINGFEINIEYDEMYDLAIKVAESTDEVSAKKFIREKVSEVIIKSDKINNPVYKILDTLYFHP